MPTYNYVGLPSLVNNPLVPTLMNSHTADPAIRKRGKKAVNQAAAELHEVFCFYNYLQIVYCKDGKECSRRNRAKNNYSVMSASEAFRT